MHLKAKTMIALQELIYIYSIITGVRTKIIFILIIGIFLNVLNAASVYSKESLNIGDLATIITEYADMGAAPGTKTVKIQRNTCVRIIGKDGNYVKVKLCSDNRQGWLEHSTLEILVVPKTEPLDSKETIKNMARN